MARPLRIEFAGAAYLVSSHVSSHASQSAVAFADDDDRKALIQLLAQTMQRFDAQVLAYQLGSADFQLLLFTRQANLSKLMRHLNGVYTQHHHRRHGGSGALFHGRFKAVLVDRETMLLDVCRFIELAPLREARVSTVDRWPWSSFRAHAGLEAAPAWLDVDGLHSFVLGRPAQTAADHRRAGERYARLVASEPALQLWPGRLRQQIFLGDEAFVARTLAAAAAVPKRPAKAGKVGPSWADWQAGSDSREQALYRAHTEGGLSMTALAATLGLSVSRVSRLIAAYEAAPS